MAELERCNGSGRRNHIRRSDGLFGHRFCVQYLVRLFQNEVGANQRDCNAYNADAGRFVTLAFVVGSKAGFMKRRHRKVHKIIWLVMPLILIGVLFVAWTAQTDASWGGPS